MSEPNGEIPQQNLPESARPSSDVHHAGRHQDQAQRDQGEASPAEEARLQAQLSRVLDKNPLTRETWQGKPTAEFIQELAGKDAMDQQAKPGEASPAEEARLQAQLSRVLDKNLLTREDWQTRPTSEFIRDMASGEAAQDQHGKPDEATPAEEARMQAELVKLLDKTRLTREDWQTRPTSEFIRDMASGGDAMERAKTYAKGKLGEDPRFEELFTHKKGARAFSPDELRGAIAVLDNLQQTPPSETPDKSDK